MPEERGLHQKMRLAEQLSDVAEFHGTAPSRGATATFAWLARFGLAERVNDDLQQLSSASQQRIQFAAALVFEPDLVVLDEPFAGLDQVAVDTMSSVLRDSAEAARPVLFSSHELDIVDRLCDRVGIVETGHMVARGTVNELRRGATERRWIDAPAAPAGWEEDVPGARLVRSEASRRLFELDPSADDQTWPEAALATGPVREFSRVEPSLGKLVRHAIEEAG